MLVTNVVHGFDDASFRIRATPSSFHGEQQFRSQEDARRDAVIETDRRHERRS
jgi:hypothetical protein